MLTSLAFLLRLLVHPFELPGMYFAYSDYCSGIVFILVLSVYFFEVDVAPANTTKNVHVSKTKHKTDARNTNRSK